MRTRSFRPVAVAFAMAFMAALATFGANTASAQFKCDPLKVTNSTKCDITIVLVSPFDIAVSYTIKAGQSISISFGLPIVSVEVKSTCGYPGLKTTGCIDNIPVEGGCCVNFCLDAENCTVTLSPSAGPCPCK